MSRWAKLHASAAESPSVGELLETNPLAVSLFFLSLARADLYGVLPADPRRYRALVAPAAILQPEVVADAIACQEAAGWVRRYEIGGTEWLHITNLERYQEVRWENRVAPPEHPLPDWWVCPDGLREYMLSAYCARGRRNGQWDAMRERYCSNEERAAFAELVLQERNRSATVAQQPHRDKQTQTQTQTQRTSKATTTPTSTDSTPAEADVSAEDAKPDPPAKPDTTQQAAANTCLAVWGLKHTDLSRPQRAAYYKAMNALMAQHEDGCEALAAWAQAEGEDSHQLKAGAKPELAIPAAVRKAVTAGAWQTAFDGTRGGARGKGNGKGEFILLTDGRRHEEKDWTPADSMDVQELKRTGNWNPETGRTKTPVRSWCCEDGLAYPDQTWPEGVPL